MNRPTSLYLDMIRPLLALVVMLSHLSQSFLTAGQLSFLSSCGVEAVDGFFVLSGFVIAYVCDSREQSAYAYMRARALRIYSVALPAIIMTLILDNFGIEQSPESYQSSYQPMTSGLLARSILFLGEQWNEHRFPGSDAPYWSLGFEIWYYAAYGFLIFSSGKWRWAGVALTLLFIGPKVAAMFPAWLMGVAAYKICARQKIPHIAGWLLLIVPVIFFALYQVFIPHSGEQQFTNLTFDPDRLAIIKRDYFIAFLFSLHIIGFSSVSPVFAPWLERRTKIIRSSAGTTFTLYLMHFPVMRVLAVFAPFPKSSFLMLLYLISLTLCACIGFAMIFERRKGIGHKFIEEILAMAERIIFGLSKTFNPKRLGRSDIIDQMHQGGDR